MPTPWSENPAPEENVKDDEEEKIGEDEGRTE